MTRAIAIGRAIALSTWARTLALTVAVLVAAVSIERIPHAAPLPLVVGLVPFILGKYVLCPLRWHAITASGRPRRWHFRVYAEGEMLGLLSPVRAAGDVWRAHQLHKIGMDHPSAYAEVGMDRLLGAIGLTAFVLLSGATMPPQVILAALGLALVVTVAALVLRRRRPNLLASRPMPPPSAIVRGIALSVAYQLTFVGLLLASTDAVGHPVDPVALLGIFGASQVAGIVPGVHGAGPREGALVLGLVSLGLPWGSALGAISLVTLVAWIPALAIGGTCLLVRRLTRHRVLATA